MLSQNIYIYNQAIKKNKLLGAFNNNKNAVSKTLAKIKKLQSIYKNIDKIFDFAKKN